MKYILVIIVLIFPHVGYAQASFEEVEAMLEGVDLEALNTRKIINCRKYGAAKEAGEPDRADQEWVVGTQAERARLYRETAAWNRTFPSHTWFPQCRPTYTQFVPTIVSLMGGARAAETALWYPRVTVVVDGERTTITDFDSRRLYANCQPYQLPGYPGRWFIKTGCTAE